MLILSYIYANKLKRILDVILFVKNSEVLEIKLRTEEEILQRTIKLLQPLLNPNNEIVHQMLDVINSPIKAELARQLSAVRKQLVEKEPRLQECLNVLKQAQIKPSEYREKFEAIRNEHNSIRNEGDYQATWDKA